MTSPFSPLYMTSPFTPLYLTSTFQVIANSNSWEGAMNTTSITMSPMTSIPGAALPPVSQPQLEQQPTIQWHGGIDHSSVLPLPHDRDRSQRYSPLGAQIVLSSSMEAGVDERHSIIASTSCFRDPLGQIGKKGDRHIGEFNAGGSTVPETSISPNHGGKAAPLMTETWNVGWGAASHTENTGGGKARSNNFKVGDTGCNNILREPKRRWQGPTPCIIVPRLS